MIQLFMVQEDPSAIIDALCELSEDQILELAEMSADDPEVADWLDE